ncbi:MAG: fibronectin type III domain-containing protein, partial [Planctomycetota bacterium]
MAMSSLFRPKALHVADGVCHRSAEWILVAAAAIGSLGTMAAQADDGPVHEPAEQVAQKQAWLAEHGGSGDDGGIAAACSGDGANLFYPFSATDGTWTLALSGNDDGSTSLISLPFAVSFFGESFPGLFINNNGNVTFGAASGTYSSTGFPANGPKMIAAFWADVDTRPAASGKVWRKSLDSNGDGTLDTFVVTWDNVGYYNNQVDKLNTFQIILTDGTNQFVGLGQRAAFSYDNMCWTTGSASGGSNGFGGTPATVGVNRGNGIDFFQIGRFNQNNANYDGPGGANDGIDYLDGKFFTFSLGSGGNAPNVPPVCTNLPSGNAVALTVGQAFDTTLNFIPPEATQTTEVQVLNGSLLQPLGFTFTPSTPGSLTTLRVQWTPGGSGVGVRSLRLRATDNAAAPASSEFTVSFSVSPLPPTNVQASDGTLTDRVRVSWQAAEGALLYRVFLNNEVNPIGEVSGLFFEDMSAPIGVNRTYRVQAVAGSVVSAMSAPAIGWRAPEAPLSVQASDGTSSVHVLISWNAVESATGYKIFRAQGVQAPVEIGEVSGQTNFLDTLATPGVTYVYRVRASTPAGVGPMSAADTGSRASSVATPTGLTATDGTLTTAVQISWTGVVNATVYRVYRDGNEPPLATTSQASFLDASAVPGQQYSYIVRAVAGGTASAESNSDTGFRNLQPPAGVSASDGTFTSRVEVSWLSAAGAVQYDVLRSQAGAGAAVIASVGGQSGSPPPLGYTDESVVPAVQYAYSVRARGAVGMSVASSADAGHAALPPPTQVSATDGTLASGVRVTWQSSAGATGYRIFRSSGVAIPTQVGSVTAPVVSFDDNTAVVGTLYTYAVRSVGAQSGSQSALSSGDGGHRALTAPTNVQASDGTSAAHVLVTWSALSGASGYRVLRSEASGTPSEIASVSGTTSFQDASAVAGTMYSYAVRGLFQAGESSSSPPDSGFRALPPPTVVSASDGSSTSHVEVVWGAVPAATEYRVLRALGSAQATQIALVSSGTSFIDASALPGVAYAYSVRAVMLGAVSAASVADVGFRQVMPPTGLAATDGTFASGVKLTWIAAAGAMGYSIERAEQGSSGEQPVQIAQVGNSLTYTDATALGGTVYAYTVRTRGSASGSVSAPSTSDTGYRPLTAPLGVQASDGTSAESVQVTWTTVNGATSYEVLRSVGAATPQPVAQGLTAPPFTDSTAAAGVAFNYFVRAASTAATSPLSAPNSGYREVAAPVNVQATDGASSTGV